MGGWQKSSLPVDKFARGHSYATGCISLDVGSRFGLSRQACCDLNLGQNDGLLSAESVGPSHRGLAWPERLTALLEGAKPMAPAYKAPRATLGGDG